MNDLSKRLAALSPEQRAIFEQRLKQRGLSAPSIQVIPRRPALDRLPLSFGQQRLWFLEQLAPGSPAYNGPSAVRLSGPLNITALEHSLNEVVRRHEALRTTFTQGADGQPIQLIAAQLDVPLPVQDLRAEAADATLAEREAEAIRQARIEFQQPFDLRRGPLVRARLLQLDEHEYLLLCTVHHIVSDGWSTELLVTELTALYAVLAAGQPPSAAGLPEPAVQYADFAVWQRDYLRGAVLESQLAYWRTQLADAPALLELPTDRPRPTVQSHHGALIPFELEQPLAQALTALAQREGVTLFMLLLACWNVLLQRWSGQDDIVVGATVSGRSRSELNNVMGFFANNLALRTSLAGNPSFRELVQRVRATALDAYSHQDVPFELLVEQLNPGRSRSHSPLFQVIFTVQNELVPTREVAGVTMRPLMIDNGTTKLDLFMFIWEGPGRLSGTLEYSTDLFDAATMERLIAQFKVLAAAIVAEPDQPIDALPLLPAAERQRLLVEWNADRRAYPLDRCLHQLFEEQAALKPDAPAVRFEEQRLSYRELNARANQLAHHLRGLGVGPEVRVGIAVGRSLELLIGALAVLKAGGAYVPLDPSYPAERIAFMLEDTQTPVLLTEQRWLATLGLEQATSGPQLVCLDRDQAAIVAQPSKNIDSDVGPANLAYVIYTSGSTGRPKGVQIAHSGINNFLQAMREQPGLSPQDVVLAITSLSFDITGLDLFLPLLVGAQIVIASQEASRSGALLKQLLADSGATVLQTTPSRWQLLIDAGWSGTPGLCMLIGGEALTSELATQLLRRGAALWNLYGPTETTVWSTLARVTDPARAPLIGRPIPNMQAYVLDAQLQPVPIGVVGELYIGGVGTGRGYLNRPALTASVFLPHPFADVPGARLYRSGDLARFLPDGTIEFLGRADHQIKLRGFRIEPGEIESVLRQHPALAGAAVAVRDEQLVAYVVAKEPRTENQEPSVDPQESGSQFLVLGSPAELRQYLQRQLPEHMIPAVFVPLDALPLTPSGKLDRRALPAVSGVRLNASHAYVAPRTPTEEVLARIWAEVLGVERVGIHDNFFDLGGHSLRAILLLSRVRDAFQIELPLPVMFESATVATLAALLVKHEAQPGRSDKIAQLLQRIKSASRAELQTDLEQRRQQSRSAQPTAES